MHKEDFETQEPLVLSNYRYNRIGGVDADRTLPSGEVVPFTLSYSPQGVEISPYTPPPPDVPKQVTMRQARLAILQAGLLGAIDSAFDAITDPTAKAAALIEWEYATTVERDAEWVADMAEALTLTEQQLDDLFLTAGKL